MVSDYFFYKESKSDFFFFFWGGGGAWGREMAERGGSKVILFTN